MACFNHLFMTFLLACSVHLLRAGLCEYDNDCKIGEICSFGQCRSTIKIECNNSFDCPETQICVSRRCRNPTRGDACKHSLECRSPQICVSGYCEKPTVSYFEKCKYSFECPDLQICVSGKCESPTRSDPCETTRDCPRPLICLHGKCKWKTNTYWRSKALSSCLLLTEVKFIITATNDTFRWSLMQTEFLFQLSC